MTALRTQQPFRCGRATNCQIAPFRQLNAGLRPTEPVRLHRRPGVQLRSPAVGAVLLREIASQTQHQDTPIARAKSSRRASGLEGVLQKSQALTNRGSGPLIPRRDRIVTFGVTICRGRDEGFLLGGAP